MQEEKIVYVYVKSQKIPVYITKEKIEKGVSPIYPETIEEEKEFVIYEEILPEESKKVIKLSEEVARERGYSIKVIDLSKEHFLKRAIKEHIEGISEFPCVVGWKNLRIFGKDIKKEHLEEIMPFEFNGIFRVFIFLKTELGKTKEVRDALLLLDEIKEAHVITGEWDILVIAELKINKNVSKYKQAIDFVENKISKIRNVKDTNTIVPEYGLTKFHVKVSI